MKELMDYLGFIVFIVGMLALMMLLGHWQQIDNAFTAWLTGHC